MRREDEDAEAAVVDADEERKPNSEQDRELAKRVMKSAAAVVRASNALPRRGDNYELCASFPLFQKFMTQKQEQINNIISKVLAVSGSKQKLTKATLRDESLFIDRIVDANDAIVERAGIILDEFDRSARNAKCEVPRAVIDAESMRRTIAADSSEAADLTGFKIPLQDSIMPYPGKKSSKEGRVNLATAKPQKTFGFGKGIDNSNSSFVVELRVKHHAIKKKKRRGMVVVEEGRSSNWKSDEGSDPHPYAYELNHFEIPDRQLEMRAPIKYNDLEATPLTMVDTVEKLDALIENLTQVDEFAVDLEAHSTRSFLGFVCLMQISTRAEDYIVDPFPIWNEMHRLNAVFADGNILKVFHGADYDLQWLQRDFNIFTRNVFDTGRAMRRLKYDKFSLAHLVQTLTGTILQKEYQLADWRVRPLPEDHVHYARSDSHYLLFCADELREKLLMDGNEHQNLLRAVYEDGVELCRKLYEKPAFDPLGYQSLIGTRRTFNNRQLYALAELWKWRDATARAEDESLQYVLPNHMMLHIAEALPREMQGILACCSPVPLLVKQHNLQLHKIVSAARDRPLEMSVTLSTRSSLGAGKGTEKSLFESIVDEENRMNAIKAMLNSQVDFSHSHFSEEIGSSLKNINQIQSESIEEKTASQTFLAAMGSVDYSFPDKEEVDPRVNEIQEKLSDWATPFERFSVAVTAHAKKDAEKRAAEEAEKAARAGHDAQGRRLYSHHDPSVSRKPVVAEEDVNVNEIALSQAAKDTPAEIGQKRKLQFSEEDILTKKKLKQFHKKARDAADISLAGEFGGEQRKKKEPVTEKMEEREEGEWEREQRSQKTEKPFQPVDYTKFDAKKMFNEGRTSHENSSFDPYRRGVVGRGKWDKRGGRGGKQIKKRGLNTSFKPSAK